MVRVLGAGQGGEPGELFKAPELRVGHSWVGKTNDATLSALMHSGDLNEVVLMPKRQWDAPTSEGTIRHVPVLGL